MTASIGMICLTVIVLTHYVVSMMSSQKTAIGRGESTYPEPWCAAWRPLIVMVLIAAAVLALFVCAGIGVVEVLGG